MEVISNNLLRVKVNLLGGTLHSIKFKDKELEYQIEENSWPCQDVIIFPLPGKNIFKYNDVIYENPIRHGIARNALFKVSEKKENEITIYLEYSEETLKYYPFKFILFLTYTLIDNKLSVKSKIINKDNNDIYASFGSHLAYIVDPNTSYIEFNKNNLSFLPLGKDGLISLTNKRNFELQNNRLFINKGLFKKYDTLVFENNDINLTLITKNNDVSIKYNFDAPIFAIWSNNKVGNYVCIEPWRGISNYTNEINDISHIKHIYKIQNEIEFNYSYEFND